MRNLAMTLQDFNDPNECRKTAPMFFVAADVRRLSLLPREIISLSLLTSAATSHGWRRAKGETNCRGCFQRRGIRAGGKGRRESAGAYRSGEGGIKQLGLSDRKKEFDK
jgi:hypothetical protein